MPDFRALESLEEVEQLAEHLLSSDLPVAFDTETGYEGHERDAGALRVYEPTQLIAGLSLTNSGDWARYIPINHKYYNNLPSYKVWEILKPVFETRKILAHNLLFDYRNVQMLPIKGDGPEIVINDFEDTMLMSYVLGMTHLHGLKHLTKHYFDYEQASLKELFPNRESWKAGDVRKIRFNDLPITPEVTSYVCDDAKYVISLYEMFTEEFSKLENKRLNFIYKVEKEILLILADMQNRGVAFDWETFMKDYRKGKLLEDYFTHEVRERFLADLGKDHFDDVLNFNSSQQMRKLLYTDLGLTTTRITKAGELSTDQLALQGLAGQSEGAAKLAEFKKFVKNLGFYETWSAYQDSYDERIHSNLSQTMVQAGRFASNDPNIQNVKKSFWFQVPGLDAGSGEEKKAFKESLLETGKNGKDYWTGSQRGYIVASEGYTLFSFDVSQGELRVLAGLANEPYLKNAFDNKVDVHTATAMQMFHLTSEEVIADGKRAFGKALSDDELVLTDNGWVRMGDIMVGDMVCSPDGTSVEVEAVYPQGERALYTVRFDDGTEVTADSEHIWSVRINKGPVERLTTKQIIYLMGFSAIHVTVDLVAPLEYNGEVTLCDVPHRFGEILAEGPTTSIPKEYLYASIGQRTCLLQGLINSRGLVTSDGNIQFYVTSECLANDITLLARSLGLFAYSPIKSGGNFHVSVSTSRTSKSLSAISYKGVGPATCILVNSDLHEFVTNGVTRTHNTLNFGIVYGMGVKLLAEQLNVSLEEAEVSLAQYFSAFKNVKNWIAGQHEMAHTLGFAETFMGRRIRLWDMERARRSPHDAGGFEAKAARLAVNSAVQGGLADIVKLSMIRAAKALKRKGWWDDKVRMLMNQHDSLVFEVSSDLQLEDVYDTLLPAVEFNPTGLYEMCKPNGRMVHQIIEFPDFVTDWEFGTSWGKMEEFER